MDFEKAAIDSFLKKFPNSDITCYVFNVSHNIYKQVIKIYLKQRYYHDDYFNLKPLCLSELAFLLVYDVIEVFEELTDEDDFPQDLVSYFETCYNGEVRGRGQ